MAKAFLTLTKPCISLYLKCGGVLTVPGTVGAAVVGVAAGVAVSSLVDNGLATVEKWIFSSQE